VSWLPTLRIARAAWKGSKDPGAAIKQQLLGDEPPAAPAQAAPAQLQAAAPAHAAAGAPAAPAVTALVTAPATEHHFEPDPVHTQLLLLMR
jgi:hypothetical protein